jgi:protein SCO1/2
VSILQRKGFVISIAVLLAAILGMVAYTLWWRANALPVLGTASDFTLESAHGGEVSFHESDGKVRVVEFMYTSCPDVCAPTTMAMAKMQEAIKAKGLSDRVQFISITLDPEVDTPEVLQAYSQRVGAELDNWVFLRGEEAKLQEIVRSYSFYFQKQDNGLVAHTSRFFLVDQDRKIRALYEMGLEADDAQVVKDIERLL